MQELSRRRNAKQSRGGKHMMKNRNMVMAAAITAIAVVQLCMPGCLSAARSDARGVAFYVSTNGKDSNPGSLKKPFRSLEKARDSVRASQKDGPVTVYLRGGMYALDRTLEFHSADGGSAKAPVTWSAYGDEHAVISGGTQIVGWQQESNGVWIATVPGVKEGQRYFKQLFTQKLGQPGFARRFRPAKGFYVTAGLTDAPHKYPKGHMRHRNPQRQVRFVKGDIQPWENLTDVELLFTHDWSCGRMLIETIDFKACTVTFKEFPHYRIGHWYPKAKNPYYIENVKEWLGTPGEWYLDRENGTLSYVPAAGEDMKTLLVIAPRLDTLISVRGTDKQSVKHLHFTKLNFHHTAWKHRPHIYAEQNERSCRQGFPDMRAALEFTWATNCSVVRCHINHCGAYGLDLAEGCHGNRIIGNRIMDNATGGIKIGTLNRKAMPPVLPTGNEIANNFISDVGMVHHSGHAIGGWMLARTHIHHNEVRRSFYGPVAIGWVHGREVTGCRENVVEYNHVYDAMLLFDHGGGIYTLGNQPGTVIRGNLIHDLYHTRLHGAGTKRPKWAAAAFGLDDGSSNFLIEDNIAYRISGDFGMSDGRKRQGHTIRNNLFEVKPGEPGFPEERAKRAGLEPSYRDLLDQPIEISPSPVLTMRAPSFR